MSCVLSISNSPDVLVDVMDNDETFDVVEVALEVQLELMNDLDHLFQLFLPLFANLQTRLEHCSALMFPWMADESWELARVPQHLCLSDHETLLR